MADNLTASPGAGGATLAFDDISSVFYPRSKISLGADGSATDAVGGAGSVSAAVQRVTLASDDPAVAALGRLGGVLSTANSSTANLAGAAVFTGTSEEVIHYAAIMVSIFSSHVSAADGLSLQQSSDGTNWDITDVYTIPATTGKTFSFQPAARYYRLVYTNGATLTTSLRIQTVFHYATPKGSSQRPQDALSNENDMEQAASFLHGYNGTTWDRLRTTGTGVLTVSAAVTTLPTLAAVTTVSTVTNVGTIGTSVTPGVAATNLGKAEDAVHASGDTGVMVLARRADTASSSSTTDGDYSTLNTDANGRLHVLDANSAAIQTAVQLIDDTIITDDAAFTVGTTKVNVIGHLADETATDSVDEGDVGASRMTLDRKQIMALYAHTAGGAALNSLIAPATPAKNVLTAAASQLYGITVMNLLATPVYLKIWDLATGSVTLGTTACTYQFMVPGNTAGAGFTQAWPQGIPFTNGIITAITGAISTTDNTSITANSVLANVTYR